MTFYFLDFSDFLREQKLRRKKGFTLQAFYFLRDCVEHCVKHRCTGLMHCWLMIKLKEQKEIGRKVREEE